MWAGSPVPRVWEGGGSGLAPRHPPLSPQGRKRWVPQMQKQDLGRLRPGGHTQLQEGPRGAPGEGDHRGCSWRVRGPQAPRAWIPAGSGLSACRGKPHPATSPSCQCGQTGPVTGPAVAPWDGQGPHLGAPRCLGLRVLAGPHLPGGPRRQRSRGSPGPAPGGNPQTGSRAVRRVGGG